MVNRGTEESHIIKATPELNLYRTKAAAQLAGMKERTFSRWAKRVLTDKRPSYVGQTNLILYSRTDIEKVRNARVLFLGMGRSS